MNEAQLNRIENEVNKIREKIENYVVRVDRLEQQAARQSWFANAVFGTLIAVVGITVVVGYFAKSFWGHP